MTCPRVSSSITCSGSCGGKCTTTPLLVTG
nr:MAG TPA: hypothetical protein [Caudoviricetes sp.]